MTKLKIVVPDAVGLSEKQLDAIKSLGSVTIYKDIPKTENEIINRIKSADIVIPTWIKITHKIMDNSNELKFIVVPSAGYDCVDIEYAASKNIKVLNCPKYNSAAVANLTIALILSLTRKIKEADSSLQNGKWIRLPYTGIELTGRKIGIIGYGNIGKKVGRIAKSLEMKIIYANSKTSKKKLDSLIRDSDIISLHLPLTEKTRRIIDVRRINMMKKGAYLINVSRGDLVDQKALINALKSKRLGGAGLDVFENEPVGHKDNKVSTEIISLAKMHNVVATPHIAFNTEEMFDRLQEEIVSDIKSCINGRPINVVN